MTPVSLVTVNSTPERARCITVIGAAILAEVGDTHQPERAQRRVIELATALDVSDAHRYMIQHWMFPWPAANHLLEEIGQFRPFQSDNQSRSFRLP